MTSSRDWSDIQEKSQIGSRVPQHLGVGEEGVATKSGEKCGDMEIESTERQRSRKRE